MTQVRVVGELSAGVHASTRSSHYPLLVIGVREALVGVRQLEQSKSVRQLPCTDSQVRMPSAALRGAHQSLHSDPTVRVTAAVSVLRYRHGPAPSPPIRVGLAHASRDMSLACPRIRK